MHAVAEPKIRSRAKETPQPEEKHIIGPTADFLLLGGGSIAPLLLIALAWPAHADTAMLAGVMMFLSNLINHPHFAHSYQLFYFNFKARAFGSAFPNSLRRRYLFAALGIPLILIAFFFYCINANNGLLLGKAANAMFFLVGWHYVKQGYGMLMVDAVLKRRFFDARTKHILLWNAYAVWITAWMLANRMFSTTDFWGISIYAYAIPDLVFWVSVAATSLTTAWMLYTLASSMTGPQAQKLPWNGIIAYLTSLYLWLLVRHPALLLVIPAFHSLQYLAVVWRYRLNIERSGTSQLAGLFPGRGPWVGFIAFVLLGTFLAYVAFWVAPNWLNNNIAYDKTEFGSTLFLFLFWIFINVHHYFLDNVMWRKDNPDTKSYLFGS